MIKYTTGNLFDSSCQVLTNAVNCVGVMGGGIALAFKRRYPDMFEDYKDQCDKGEYNPGEPRLWTDGTDYILNFPTKDHYENDSQLSWLDSGLASLAMNYVAWGITSIAIPALGCGLGGLSWSDVQPLIEKHLGDLPDLYVEVYEPHQKESI